jgi:hypothetical protein
MSPDQFDDQFDDRLRDELHESLDGAQPSPLLRQRTAHAVRRRPRLTPRTMLLVAGAAAALLLVGVAAGALTKGNDKKTRLASEPPVTVQEPASEPSTTTEPPTTAAAVEPATTTTSRPRTTTTTGPTPTTTPAPPPTLPAYNPPKSAVNRGPGTDEGCAALVLTVATDHTYYLKGSPIPITVTVSNPSNTPCSQACPPSYWLQTIVAAKDSNATTPAGFNGKGAFGCGGAIAAHGSYSTHYTWCQVMNQNSDTDNTCPYNGQAADAPSGTYTVAAYTNFTTEGDQEAGPMEIIIE